MLKSSWAQKTGLKPSEFVPWMVAAPRREKNWENPLPLRERDPAVSLLTVPPSTSRDLSILRWGVFLVWGGIFVGILLLFLATTLGRFAPLMAGLGMSAFWISCGTLAGACYLYGLRTGKFLISPRSSITAIIGFFGLAIVAFIAAIEFTL